MYTLILHGRRFLGLEKWIHLRASVQKVSALFSTASVVTDVKSQDGLKGKTFTVSYLIASLGFSTKLAESISRRVSFEDTCNADSVLSLLRSHEFNDSQISNIIRVYPKLLILDAEKSIGPKLKFLKSREGVSTSELTEVLSKVPKIFGVKREKATSVYYDFVKEIIEADKSSEFEKLCGSSLPKEGSKQGNKMRNVSVLRELGVPQKVLFAFIFNSRVCCGKERFEESLKKVVEMGFDPSSSKFVYALQAFHDIGEKTMEEKVNVYRKLGFDVEHVWEMFKKSPHLLHYSETKIKNSFQTFLGLGFSRDECAMIAKRLPTCIGLSAESVKKKTEFLVKTMNWPLKDLVTYALVFGYSMEKRVVPRCNVIKALLSKGLLGTEIPPISSVLSCTNEVFLYRYVKKHNDKDLVAELMVIFTEKNK